MSTTAPTPRLEGRRLYLPCMSDCGAEVFAAAFRSAGLDAIGLPPPDARTLELGARHLNGDECLLARVTLGDFLKLVEAPGFRSAKTAFFMPRSEGPCRLGYSDVLLISPTDGDGYQETETYAPSLMRTGWRAVVSADLLTKLLLKTRPYECSRGDADHAYLVSRRELRAALETPAASARAQMSHLVDTLTRIHDRFRTIPCRYEKGRLFIGIQGEIFCRMEDCSNGHLIRHPEACGAEAWLSDLSEWVWYSNTCEEQRLSHTSRLCSLAMLRAKLRDHAQRSDQLALHAPFAEDLKGYDEPKVPATLLKAGYAYLPFTCTEGEMVLSAGKVDHLFRHGVDGIIDVSPFSCMNGIVSEALYPRVSQDHADLPIKNVYVDGTGRDLTSELEIFIEMARTYQSRKRHGRRYSPLFS